MWGKYICDLTKGNWYEIPRQQSFRNAYEIKDITLNTNGNSAYRYTLTKEGDTYIIDEAKRTVAGRVVGLGPSGISFEAYTYVDTKDYDRIVQKSENREDLIGELMISSFDQGITLHLPERVVRLPIAEQRKTLEEVITTSLDKRVFNKNLDLKELGKYRLKPGATENINLKISTRSMTWSSKQE